MVTPLRHIAVIIGINQYDQGIPPLHTAVNDAQALADLLTQEHHYQTHLFLDEQASRLALYELLDQTLPKLVQAGDRLLFYFAGHGIALNGEDGPEGYLIPQNARLGETASYLPMTYLQKSLEQLPCRHFLGILDCCFAGAFRWSGTRDLVAVPEVLHQEHYEHFLEEPAWQVLTSAAYDQKALDVSPFLPERASFNQNSPFATALLEALRGKADLYPPRSSAQESGNGVITATELYLYLRDRLETLSSQSKHQQTPGLWPLKKHDKGEYIFLNPQKNLRLTPAPPLSAAHNPYRGLQSFEEEHSHLFFGRKTLIKKLYGFVESHPLTVVLGVSGRGKSSLVKAGLIPYIKQKDAMGWRILPPIRLGCEPLATLQRELSWENLNQLASATPLKTRGALSSASSTLLAPPPVVAEPQTFRFQSPPDVIDRLGQWLNQHSSYKLLLVIDQFEELATLGYADSDREQVLAYLVKLLNLYPRQIRLIVTLRSDFEPQFQDGPLKAFWPHARFWVPGMTRAELREAIEEPARSRVLFFQSFDPQYPLVDQLIDEVADMPGALPLLSFTLSELYLKYLNRQHQAQLRKEVIERAITEADYQELGGVVRSLTQRADREYESLVAEDPRYETYIRHLFLRLITVGQETSVRRRVPLTELIYPPAVQPLITKIIQRFVEARLLIQGQEKGGHSYLEAAHDALIQGWPRLLTWRREYLGMVVLQRRLTPAAIAWQERIRLASKAQKPEELLWHNDPTLPILINVLKTPHHWLNQVEQSFVQQSQKKRQQSLTLRWLLVSMILIGSLGFSGMLWMTNRQSQANLAKALAQQADALFNNHRQLVALTRAIEAGRVLQSQGLQNQEVRDILQTINTSLRVKNLLVGHLDEVIATSWSPDGQIIATASRDGSLKLWSARGQLLKTVDADTKASQAITWHPDGQSLATANSDGLVKLWNRQGQLLRYFRADSHNLLGIAWSPDGRQLLTGGSDQMLSLWTAQGRRLKTWHAHHDMINSVAWSRPINGVSVLASGSRDRTIKLWTSDGQPLRTLTGHQQSVNVVTFSPDGQWLASGSDDTTVRLWRRSGQMVRTIPASDSSILTVAFSPNNRTLLSAGADQTISRWNLQGQLQGLYEGSRGSVYSVAWSPDGQTLVGACGDQNVVLWQVERSVKAIFNAHSQEINRVYFSPDRRFLASASDDGTIKLWTLQGQLIRTIAAHQQKVYNIVIHPQGKLLASAGQDGTIKLWTIQGQLVKRIPAHNAEIWWLEFSPDGQLLASASEDRTIKLWNSQGQLLHTLKGHQDSVEGIAFSRDSQLLVSASNDKTLKVWNRQGQLLRTLHGHQGGVWAVAISPNGQQIASASVHKTIRLWTIQGKLLKTMPAHLGGIWSLIYSPNGKMFASASEDNTVKLWSAEGELIKTIQDHLGGVWSAEFSADNQWLTTAGKDQTIFLYDLERSHLTDSLDTLLDEACRWSKDFFTYSAAVTEQERKLCP